MAMTNQICTKLFLLTFFGVLLIQGLSTHHHHHHDEVSHPYHSHRTLHFQNYNGGLPRSWNSRRTMIGSTVPRCTYNECRGCEHKCMPKQVPVESNNPINSAYHYKCICHHQ